MWDSRETIQNKTKQSSAWMGKPPAYVTFGGSGGTLGIRVTGLLKVSIQMAKVAVSIPLCVTIFLPSKFSEWHIRLHS